MKHTDSCLKVNLKNIMLSERREARKAIYCVIPFYVKCPEKENLLIQKVNQWVSGARESRELHSGLRDLPR